MRIVMILIELLLVLVCVYLFLNLIRFAFFKGAKGGGLFGLSDQWIRGEQATDVPKESDSDKPQ